MYLSHLIEPVVPQRPCVDRVILGRGQEDRNSAEVRTAADAIRDRSVKRLHG